VGSGLGIKAFIKAVKAGREARVLLAQVHVGKKQPPHTHIIFLYLICHDFRKINGRIKIFEKCTSGVVAHGGRLLPPRGTTAVAWFRRQGGAAQRQDPAGSRSVPPCHTAAGFFL
jgi:hypothetical protein